MTQMRTTSVLLAIDPGFATPGNSDAMRVAPEDFFRLGRPV